MPEHNLQSIAFPTLDETQIAGLAGCTTATPKVYRDGQTLFAVGDRDLNFFIVKSGEMPQLSVRLDREALARYDLDLADVQDYLETAMAGHVASELWDGEKRFDVTVRLPQASREDPTSIRKIMLPLKDGALIPVSAVADVRMATGRAAIRVQGRFPGPAGTAVRGNPDTLLRSVVDSTRLGLVMRAALREPS